MPPTLYIKNALRIAELGLGDGTVYYSGTGGVIPNQANKTFQFFTLAAIDDLPAPVDDALNGYILYFPNSRNIYHIVDFVASTSIVTTWEVPDMIDKNLSTGYAVPWWTIRPLQQTPLTDWPTGRDTQNGNGLPLAQFQSPCRI